MSAIPRLISNISSQLKVVKYIHVVPVLVYKTKNNSINITMISIHSRENSYVKHHICIVVKHKLTKIFLSCLLL